MSKRLEDKGEVVYGTITRLLTKTMSQLNRLYRLQSGAQQELHAAGIVTSSHDMVELPFSELTNGIIDRQEELVEDIVFMTSINIRILSEVFPQKLNRFKVNVYDYDDRTVGRLELSRITNLLVHNRYICIRNPYIVDLMSDRRFMDRNPQAGLKIHIAEYLSEVERTVSSVTVNDLALMLQSGLDDLSVSSSIKDIIHLHQNLYTLGGLIIGDGIPISSGPIKTILDRVATNYLTKAFAHTPLPEGETVAFSVVSDTPRFTWEPDLNKRQILISLEVNGTPESLAMGYEEFFEELRVYGDLTLCDGSVS